MISLMLHVLLRGLVYFPLVFMFFHLTRLERTILLNHTMYLLIDAKVNKIFKEGIHVSSIKPLMRPRDIQQTEIEISYQF